MDTRTLEDPRFAERGIGRYARCLLDALGEAGRDVLATRGLRRSDADVLHSPSISGAPIQTRTPLVVTLHDLVPMKRPREYLRTGLRHRYWWAAVKRAERVIVPSRAVAADAEQMLELEPDRIAVVPEAAAAVFRPVEDPAAALGRHDLPERFLLWVGGLDPPDPRKRIEELAATVSQGSGTPLVLAGRVGTEAAGLAEPGRVLLTGRVTDEELAALYTAADAVVFPSDDEGFGLPPVEALACGTPVAAFAAGGLTEALEGVEGAELVRVGDYSGLLAAAERLAGAPVRAPGRTWADVAAETWAVYEAARRA